jgi:hypothetical protein
MSFVIIQPHATLVEVGTFLVSCLPLLLLGGHLVSFSFFLLIFPRKRPIIFIASLYLAVSIGHPKSEFRTTPPDYKCGGHGGNTIDDGCR